MTFSSHGLPDFHSWGPDSVTGQSGMRRTRRQWWRFFGFPSRLLSYQRYFPIHHPGPVHWLICGRSTKGLTPHRKQKNSHSWLSMEHTFALHLIRRNTNAFSLKWRTFRREICKSWGKFIASTELLRVLSDFKVLPLDTMKRYDSIYTSISLLTFRMNLMPSSSW